MVEGVRVRSIWAWVCLSRTGSFATEIDCLCMSTAAAMKFNEYLIYLFREMIEQSVIWTKPRGFERYGLWMPVKNDLVQNLRRSCGLKGEKMNLI